MSLLLLLLLPGKNYFRDSWSTEDLMIVAPDPPFL